MILPDKYVNASKRDLGKRLARIFAVSKIPPEKWATDVYRLPSGGRFTWEFAPYARRMFQAIFEREVLETAFMLYSRGLKSTVVLLAIGYIIDQSPRRILNLWPTNGQAEKFSKDNLCGELFNTTPCLNYLGNDTGRRIASNTLLHKSFPGGLIDMFGANAPGDMRRAKGSFLYSEEIDAIGEEQTDEGDQLTIFNKRGDEYPDTIRVTCSYPALKVLDAQGRPQLGHSRIDSKLLKSDYNEWHSTCVVCGGEPFVMHRSMLVYDQDKPQGARFKCPRCGEFLDDKQRYSMAHKQGFDNWKARNEFKGRRGFHANAMLWPHPVDLVKMPGGFLQMLAQQEIDANTSQNPKRSMRVLVNTVDAEPFDATDENEKPPDWKVIYDRREDYGLIVPQKALFLTAFCDVQKNRLEIGWRAWGRREESWGMDHIVIEGFVGHPEVWQGLATEMGRVFTHESGAEIYLGMGFVDGGAYAEDVYRFFSMLTAYFNPMHPLHKDAKKFFKSVSDETLNRVRGHLRASKGMGKHPHPFVVREMATVAKNLKGHHIGTWQCKDRIYERLRETPSKDTEIAALIHYNKQYTEGFFSGLTLETATQHINGAEIYNTYKDEVSGNEPLDIEVGNLAAWRLYPRNLDAIEADILARAAICRGDAEPLPEETIDGAVISSGGRFSL